MLIYTVRFISFPDDCGNTLKHRTEIRGVYWKQCDTCLCKNSTAKSKMEENRPTSCLHSVSLFLTCSTVSFQSSVSLDFCEIYLAKIVQEVGKKGRMKIRVCPEHNSLSPPPQTTQQHEISVAEGHADNCNNIICCASGTWLLSEQEW